MTEINWNYIIYRYRYSIDLMDKFRDADIITEKIVMLILISDYIIEIIIKSPTNKSIIYKV